MKTRLPLSVLSFLLLAVASPCMAAMSIEKVSTKRAKELGIEMRAKGNGPNEVWIELEFKPEGELKGFNHVSLEIRDGEKFLLGWTALGDRKLGTGARIVTLLVNRAYAEKVTLTVVCGAMGDVGHVLRVKDFVDLKKVP